MDLQTIKKKYSIKSDIKIFIGNADEIRYLFACIEGQQTIIKEQVDEIKRMEQEYATLNESIAEADAMIMELQNEVKQYKLQESLLLERLQKQTLQLKEMKQNSRLQRFYSMAEENLKLAQENARLKELGSNAENLL